MGFFNSLRNIKKWFTNKTGITEPKTPTKRKHDECETISNKKARMDDSLVEVVEISDESLSEAEEVEITEPGPSTTVPLRASPPVMLINNGHHQRSKLPDRIENSNDHMDKIKIIRSYSLSNQPTMPHQTMGMVQSVSNQSIIGGQYAHRSAIKECKKSCSNMESGFSALSIGNTTPSNDNTQKVLAMILKNYVLPKPDNTETSPCNSRSPLSLRKAQFLSQSNLSQTSGKENLEIPELSQYKNRIIKQEMFYERILRKFKEKQEAASQVLATMKQKQPEDIFREKLEIMKRELQKIEPKKKLEIFPNYSQEVKNFIRCQMSRPQQQFIVQGKNIKISDLKTLYHPTGWLNDEVINHYLSMVVERNSNFLHAFATFFYNKLESQGYQSVRRWTKKKDIFACKKIFAPIHLGNHWCLICVNFIEKTIKYYDSLKGKNPTCLNTIFNYLKEEFKDKKNGDFDCSGWRLMDADDCPEQHNGFDCGVFTCVNTEFLARDADLDFVQNDMVMLRQKLCYEILKNKLIY